MSVFISIIVPAYKVEKYIAKCIDSILAEPYEFMELILVDDGSPDSSGEICDVYALKYPDVVHVIHQENKGLGSARNVGLSVAKGEYILFVDSDDYLQAGTVAKLANYIEHMHFPDMIIYNYRWVDDKGNTLKVSMETLCSGQVYSSLETKEILFTQNAAWNRIVRKSFYKDNDIIFPDHLWYEDLCVTVKLMMLPARVGFVSDVLYNYLVREGSIMHNSELDRKADMLKVFDNILLWAKDNGLLETWLEEMEYIAIYHVLYSTSIDILKSVPYHPLLDELREYLIKNFQFDISNKKNKYLSRLSLRKKITLRLIYNRKYKPLYFAYKVLR